VSDWSIENEREGRGRVGVELLDGVEKEEDVSVVLCYVSYEGIGGKKIDSNPVPITNLSSFYSFSSSSSSMNPLLLSFIIVFSVLIVVVVGCVVLLCVWKWHRRKEKNERKKRMNEKEGLKRQLLDGESENGEKGKNEREGKEEVKEGDDTERETDLIPPFDKSNPNSLCYTPYAIIENADLTPPSSLPSFLPSSLPSSSPFSSSRHSSSPALPTGSLPYLSSINSEPRLSE
jgi:hypothetical protein